MIISKGYRVSFTKENGRTVKAPASYGLLHDPDGKDWPRCSALIAPFRRGVDEELDDGLAKDYFNYIPRGGRMPFPPRRLSGWRELGPVVKIEYIRPGDKEIPGKFNLPYDHDFRESALPVLYRHGKLLRLEMIESCVWNWRGICKP